MARATIWGETSDGGFGRLVRSGGDLDGDGLLDVLVAEPYGRGAAPTAGRVHVLYGGMTGESSAADSDATCSARRAGT